MLDNNEHGTVEVTEDITDIAEAVSVEAFEATEATAEKEKLEAADIKLTELFAYADAEKTMGGKKNSFSLLVREVMILELISMVLFFICMSAELPGPLSFFAVLLPVIWGIGYRVYSKGMPLREAISKCKLHIVFFCFFFMCILLSV
ncbi:MAG: hypothetical protein J5724_07170 [Ruminococcus sp.]|nr:hypothetical protein [Ruminococcus sp.]